MMTVLNNWFVRNRSIAMALAMERVSGGRHDPGARSCLRYKTLMLLVDQDGATQPCDRPVLVAVAFPLSRLVRNAPEPYGQYPDGQASAQQSASLPPQGHQQTSRTPHGKKQFRN